MTRVLRIGVDALNLLHDRRGIGRYARALLRDWLARRREDVAITLLVPHLFPGLVRARLAAEIGNAGFDVARRARVARLGLDLVWYPWNGMTWVAPCPRVATVHDVWPFASPSSDVRIRRSEQTPFLRTATFADRIVADSAFTKSEIVRHLAVDAGKIDVVHLGVDADRPGDVQPAAPPRGAQRYVLFVGEAEPRKDLPTLLSAMAQLPDALRQSTALVVVGRAAPDTAARDFTAIYEGEVTDERLWALYAGAAAFAFPSRYEGFGLPVLEAMAFGAPVVASDAASVPEAGGDAALYFRAGDPSALSRALGEVLNDAQLAKDLRAAGKQRAARMTSRRTADETLRIFQRLVL